MVITDESSALDGKPPDRSERSDLRPASRCARRSVGREQKGNEMPENERPEQRYLEPGWFTLPRIFETPHSRSANLPT